MTSNNVIELQTFINNFGVKVISFSEDILFQINGGVMTVTNKETPEKKTQKTKQSVKDYSVNVSQQVREFIKSKREGTTIESGSKNAIYRAFSKEKVKINIEGNIDNNPRLWSVKLNKKKI